MWHIYSWVAIYTVFEGLKSFAIFVNCVFLSIQGSGTLNLQVRQQQNFMNPGGMD